MEMARERKSDKVRALVAEGNYKEALKIASEFRLGISREDKDTMKRGYESIVWPRFYESIGLDPEVVGAEGVEALIRIYGNKTK